MDGRGGRAGGDGDPFSSSGDVVTETSLCHILVCNKNTPAATRVYPQVSDVFNDILFKVYLIPCV